MRRELRAPATDALQLATFALKAEQYERRVYDDAPWPDERTLYVTVLSMPGSIFARVEGASGLIQ